MARARLLKPGFFTNEDLLELPFEGRLLFAGLWCLADREGRLEDRPKRIKIELFPGDNIDVNALMDALNQRGFIHRYESGSQALVHIRSFGKHQKPHPREAASTLPACPCEACMEPATEPRTDLGNSKDKPRTDLGRAKVTGIGSSSGSSEAVAVTRHAAAPADEDLYLGVRIPPGLRDRVIEHCMALGERNLDAETVQAVIQCHEDLPAEDIDWARRELRRAVPRRAAWPSNVREVLAQRDGVSARPRQAPQQERIPTERIPMAEEVFEQIRNRPAVPVPDELEYLRANDPEAYERELAHRERSRAKLAARMAANGQAT